VFFSGFLIVFKEFLVVFEFFLLKRLDKHLCIGHQSEGLLRLWISF